MMPAGMIDEIVAALEDHWTLGQKHAMALAVTGMLAKALAFQRHRRLTSSIASAAMTRNRLIV